jgi:hypothetical protein
MPSVHDDPDPGDDPTGEGDPPPHHPDDGSESKEAPFDPVQEADEESFPASDPPATWRG